MDFDALFQSQLDALKAEGNYRIFAELERKKGQFPRAISHSANTPDQVTVWCSNDYLGMGQHPAVTGAMHEAIDAVGPFGHFFGADHTQSRYRDAFYAPLMSDWRNYETWLDDGGVWAHQRAQKHYKTVLNEYVAPQMDSAHRDQLADYVARRKEEGGAPTDY